MGAGPKAGLNSKPHHQNAFGDGDYDGGSDTHGFLALHNGVGFGLNQPIRVDEAHDLHDRVRSGWMLPKNSPWTVATRSQSLSVGQQTLVRITSVSLPRSSSIADWIISRHLRA